MKKQTVLWILMGLFPALLFGQYTEQGNFIIGTTLGFSSAHSKVTQEDGAADIATENPVSTQLSISPSMGYFLVDHLALGLGMDYTFNRVERNEGDTNKDSDLLFGPFVRYYVPVAQDMAFFLEGNFGFGNASDNLVLGSEVQRINTNIMAMGVGPGFTIFSGSAIGIEALLKYNYARSKFDTDIGGVQRQTISRTNQFDFSIGLQYYIGGVEPARSPSPRHY
ncbi:hypothetical protein [Phaeodactylibacter luteus]|nr:hypothetical protein [Phaeodactylibacter luteus]